MKPIHVYKQDCSGCGENALCAEIEPDKFPICRRCADRAYEAVRDAEHNGGAHPADASEVAYMAGSKAAWQIILGQALVHLGAPEPGRSVLELEQARLQAKFLCERIGVEYDPNLHLADIIEKRIGRYIEKVTS